MINPVLAMTIAGVSAFTAISVLDYFFLDEDNQPPRRTIHRKKPKNTTSKHHP